MSAEQKKDAEEQGVAEGVTTAEGLEEEESEATSADGDEAAKDAEEQAPSRKVELTVSADKMAVTLSCTVDPENLIPLKQAIRERMKILKLEVPGLNIDEWLMKAAAENPEIEEGVLHKGVPPVQPKEGRIEWGGDFFSKGFVVDPKTGAIDYRKKTAQTTVEDGQLLARIIPPVEGTEGLDVFGKRIKVRKGKVQRIRAAGNVRHEESDDSFFASSAGRIRWRGGTLSVDEVYTVEGDVDLDTGDISHPGTLVVEGDILEGASVEASGDIEVRGLVEPSKIKAGGNLVVYGGLTGSDKYTVEVGGTVHAKFILDGTIDADDDVEVEKEILNSKIRTRGAVKVTSGRVVGGEIMALGGVEIHVAGSDAEVKTHISVGVDFMLLEELEERVKELDALKESRDKIKPTIIPLLRLIDKLPKSKAEAVKKLASQLKETEARIAESAEEVDALRKSSADKAVCRAVISGLLHRGAAFTIQAETLNVKDEFKGPVQAILSEGQVVLMPMTAK